MNLHLGPDPDLWEYMPDPATQDNAYDPTHAEDYAGPPAPVGDSPADPVGMHLFDDKRYLERFGLRDRFGTPPFSVLDASQGEWQERKRDWVSLGLESEVGRDASPFGFHDATDEVSLKMAAQGRSSISVFDPVLCELVYRWWSPAGASVLDPFAGGSVRGVVAAATGRRYVGVELRAEQVEANRDQWATVSLGLPCAAVMPLWITGDSATAPIPADPVDLVFSCPPYGDLEVYSDDPRDLSAMSPAGFRDAYRAIIARACERLADDRFAVFVVGQYRDRRTTHIVDLVGMTIDAFGSAGADYYGDLVLVTPVGSAAMRASASFDAGRKPMPRHQYVLVFVKGDWRRAARAAEAFLRPEDDT